jgi:hypothetical protein
MYYLGSDLIHVEHYIRALLARHHSPRLKAIIEHSSVGGTYFLIIFFPPKNRFTPAKNKRFIEYVSLLHLCGSKSVLRCL